VECDEATGHVIGLDLSDSCLSGPLNSSSSLFRLVHLQSLNLAYNYFHYSQIPFAVGNLSRLTHLNLSHSSFSGQIPSGVSHLSKLSSLDLSWNSGGLYTGSDLRSFVQNFTSLEELLLSGVNISSVVPESLANLSSLKTLDLEYCELLGEFPTRLFQLPNLRDLSIAGNWNLTGQLPEFHSNTSLEVLDLYNLGFYGKLPTSIGNLRSLRFLDVIGCHFSGSIPHSLSNLTQLIDLSLLGNNLEGTIPSSFSELKSIVSLDLGGNNLEGTIPSSFSELKSIESLDFHGNNLSGMQDFDMFLNFKNLTWLDLSSNNLTLLTKANSNDTLSQFESLNLGSCNLRKFPNFLRNQNKLRFLNLSDNNLQGLVPKWFYNVSVKSLEYIKLSNNFLVGFEPSPMVLPWSKLSSLDLSNNTLQGSLPILLICNLSSLNVLDLSYNKLSGMLPPCLGNFSSPLSVLKLQSNNFHGTIPKTWSKGSGLRMIDLSENNLQGQLPRSMANCTILEYFHVGNNQINDTFPFWLGNLSWLKVLVLRYNAFHGAIKSPEINYIFPGLHIIDLSHNSFSGNMPAEYFLHWNAMKVVSANQLIYMELFTNDSFDFTTLCTVTVTNKGINLEYDKIQDELTIIDFSSNKFEGEIPEILGTLKGLHSLNLSNNALIGYIPPSLGNLTNIESMDLSENKLFGEIPPQLAQLFFT
jgi:Leucine-rich repeat (LRR) protein